MKTAISVPNETFARVEAAAAELGVSRSTFFTNAAEFYIRTLGHGGLTERVNAAVRLQPAAAVAESGAFVAAGTAAMEARWEDDPW